ncbi:hypothetical protein J2M53_13490 [Arthrobacter sp. zg-ZUI100]|uniref:hypothetical protein n=1 Tax=Arthrobacter jiangjiafuii TaxID=2817475 RepID=UPI001AED4A45|nr:hypothetical protein [Arthrobacter jiangjiafuii]MBP3037258.1 hypothetical protein [Arthrobacter jiangjiafuii]
MIEQSRDLQADWPAERPPERPLREFSGTYGGFYLPWEAWGVPVAEDGSPHARCCSCSWEHDAATEEDAVGILEAHLRAAHPWGQGPQPPSGSNRG